MTKPAPMTPRERAAKRRVALRAQGLRRKELWVPDVRTPEFKAQARRAALAVAHSPHESNHQAFVDSIGCWDELSPCGPPLDD